MEQPGEEFPQSPLLLLDEALPNMDHEGYFSMFDAFQDSNVEPATHLKKEAEPGPSSLSISQQTSESMGQENPARESEEIELEQTLMDIVLHTIFQDLEAPPSTVDCAVSSMSRCVKFKSCMKQLGAMHWPMTFKLKPEHPGKFKVPPPKNVMQYPKQEYLLRP